MQHQSVYQRSGARRTPLIKENGIARELYVKKIGQFFLQLSSRLQLCSESPIQDLQFEHMQREYKRTQNRKEITAAQYSIADENPRQTNTALNIADESRHQHTDLFIEEHLKSNTHL